MTEDKFGSTDKELDGDIDRYFARIERNHRQIRLYILGGVIGIGLGMILMAYLHLSGNYKIIMSWLLSL